MSTTTIERLQEADRLLAEVSTVDDARNLANMAEAARVYAKQMKLGTSAVNHATSIKIRAELRLARIVDEGQERGEIAGHGDAARTKARGAGVGPDQGIHSEPATFEELGIDSRRLAESRKLADAYSDEDIVEMTSEATEEGREVSRSELLKKTNGVHVGNNSGENEWYTPVHYIDAAREAMGSIDLDPATSLAANEIVKAKRIYTVEDDGLTKKWQGNVWMNPPYGSSLIGLFIDKLVEERSAGNTTQACVLVNNGTETSWFQKLARHSSALCFPAGRIRFWYPDRPSLSPLQGQVFLYLGDQPAAFRKTFKQFGVVK